MQTYAMFRRRTDAWDQAAGIEQQAGWPAHGAFMTALAGQGAVLAAGPLADDGALIVVRAADEAAAEALFADDPWTLSGLLETEWIRPWHVRVGAVG